MSHVHPQSTWISINTCMVCNNKFDEQKLSSFCVPPPPQEKYAKRLSFIVHCENPACGRAARKSRRECMSENNCFYIDNLFPDVEYLIPRSDGGTVSAKIFDRQLTFIDNAVHMWFGFDGLFKRMPLDVVIKHNSFLKDLDLHLDDEFREDCPALFEQITQYMASIQN